MGLSRLDQDNHTAAEATAGHAGSQNGVASSEDLDNFVDLPAGNTVNVAERIVRGVQQPPELGEIAPAQSGDGFEGATVLARDVHGGVGRLATEISELSGIRVREVLDWRFTALTL